MTCSNCGAELKDGQLLCSYCGSENEKIAKNEQNEYITYYKKKAEELKDMPDEKLKKSSKSLMIVAVTVLGVFVVCVLLAVAVSCLTGDNSLEKQNEQVAKLEKYYNAGEYKEMYEYLVEIDEYGATFEKYERAGNLYDNMDWRIDALKSENDFIKKLDLKPEEVATAMSYAFEELVVIKSYEDEGYKYGEEKAVMYVKEQYVKALKEYMLLGEAEIEDAVALYNGEESLYELAEKAILRIKENQ